MFFFITFYLMQNHWLHLELIAYFALSIAFNWNARGYCWWDEEYYPWVTWEYIHYPSIEPWLWLADLNSWRRSVVRYSKKLINVALDLDLVITFFLPTDESLERGNVVSDNILSPDSVEDRCCLTSINGYYECFTVM